MTLWLESVIFSTYYLIIVISSKIFLAFSALSKVQSRYLESTEIVRARTISVDSRYLLWTLDKAENAKNILEEITIIK